MIRVSLASAVLAAAFAFILGAWLRRDASRVEYEPFVEPWGDL